MEIALHGACTGGANLATDIRSARAAGFSAIELDITKLLRFLDAGHELSEVRGLLGDLRVSMLDALLGIETQDPRLRGELLRRCERIAPIAADLGCPAIQIVALTDFRANSWAAQLRQLGAAIGELADIT
ncbi:MAG: hypothetical protein ACRC0L_06510, partial [Angustibacter sp.]